MPAVTLVALVLAGMVIALAENVRDATATNAAAVTDAETLAVVAGSQKRM
jgi:hypothetical protein